MNLIKPSFEILSQVNGEEILKLIEKAGRVCYKSEDKITPDSSKKFVDMVLKRGHESVIEHFNVTVRVICDRGVSHEIVRHRLASYSQESTRYCNYKGGVTFVIPTWFALGPGEHKPDFMKVEEGWENAQTIWMKQMYLSEKAYLKLIELGQNPQQARSVLPNSLKTEIVMTMNLREWRHFFKLRTAPTCHPQMLEITKPMLDEFKKLIPVIFDDIVWVKAL